MLKPPQNNFVKMESKSHKTSLQHKPILVKITREEKFLFYIKPWKYFRVQILTSFTFEK